MAMCLFVEIFIAHEALVRVSGSVAALCPVIV